MFCTYIICSRCNMPSNIPVSVIQSSIPFYPFLRNYFKHAAFNDWYKIAHWLFSDVYITTKHVKEIKHGECACLMCRSIKILNPNKSFLIKFWIEWRRSLTVVFFTIGQIAFTSCNSPGQEIRENVTKQGTGSNKNKTISLFFCLCPCRVTSSERETNQTVNTDHIKAKL